MPRTITLFKKCIHHKIPSNFIDNIHFNDLMLLLLSLDIEELETALKQQANTAGVKTKNISSNDAIKFLKGGASNGG